MIATIELAAAVLLAVLALTVPVVAALLVVAIWLFAVRRIRLFFARHSTPEAPSQTSIPSASVEGGSG